MQADLSLLFAYDINMFAHEVAYCDVQGRLIILLQPFTLSQCLLSVC